MDAQLLQLYESILAGNLELENGVHIDPCVTSERLVTAILSVGCFYNKTKSPRILGALARRALDENQPSSVRLAAYQMVGNVLG